MHEAEGNALGIDYRYRLFDPDAEQLGTLQDILDHAEAEGFAGVNVTYPFKQDVIQYLDQMSDAARKIGAVNTVVFREGTRCGHNTDYWGFSEGFRRGLGAVTTKTVLQLGAGGAGSAVAHAMADLGAATLLIYDTRPGASETLASSVNIAEGRDVARPIQDPVEAADTSDGIVNTTPVGMAKLPGSPIDRTALRPHHWVAEIIYFPLQTELLRMARAAGCRTLDGAGMAVFQAVRAFKLFSGFEPDPARMRATFEALGNT